MKRFPALRMMAAAAFAAAALSTALDAGASGDYGPSYTMFKAYRSPDIPLERFQAGELGILQPGMRRVYLYTAWRAIALGPRAAQAPGIAGGLARADGSAFSNGWADSDAGAAEPQAEAQAPMPPIATVLQLREGDPALRKYYACPPAGNELAAKTYHMLGTRPDANKDRITAWARAQYQVGVACQEAEDARYRYGQQEAPQLAPPAPLSESEPVFWRQLRDYQRAAWHFYLGHHAESTAQFERIGATRGHPMQGLGAYLALRSEVRRAVAGAKAVDMAGRDRQAGALERRGDAILADASLAPMHEPARALLRAMRVRLTPEIRLEELSRYLDNPAADPFALDRLGDWAILMDGAKPAARRGQHEFIDWIETLRDCDQQTADSTCAAQAAHALERWQQTKTRPWLVAAMMLAPAMPAAMERAALAVGAGDPSWLTVHYHLARLYRLAGRKEDARVVSEAALQRKLSPGTRNLFREERFAAASSVKDASAWLLRTNVDFARNDPRQKEDMLNDDALLWFRSGLPMSGMIELARIETLPKELRANAAGAAWIRAALLDDQQAGAQAAETLAGLAPELRGAAERYRRATSAEERRHAVLVAALRFGLPAQLDMMPRAVQRVADDDVTASAWCSFKARDDELGRDRGFAWRLPAPPDTGNAAAAQDELARLAPMKTATGVVGDDVLQWMNSHPKDPELPWLLYVVVQSTRGGCLDPGASSLSRKAFSLLHKRYPGTEWEQKTPYYF
jgi:hypothetical protein